MPPVTGPTTNTVDPEVLNRLGTPQASEALRRGNVDEILKVTGISKKDWEEYLKAQSVSLNRDVVQNYQIYAEFGSIPAPQWNDHFSPELSVGAISPQDHHAFMESMGRLTGKAMVGGGKSSTGGKSQEAPASLQGLVEDYMKETDDLLLSVADKALETQLQMDYDKQSQKMKEEFLQLLANANDPETILMALTQYKMRQSGLIMQQEGRRVYQTNMAQSRGMEALSKISTSDPRYFAEAQRTQAKQSQLGVTMQQHMSTMQTAIQNVESALNFGKSTLNEYSRNKDSILRNTSVRS